MKERVQKRSDHSLGRLWRQYLEARAEMEDYAEGSWEHYETGRRAVRLRDRVIVNYSPLVKYVAGLLPSRMRGVVDHEDVLSWGVIGLLKAVETFDSSRGAKFESYAISRIRWSILDEYRSQDWVPRRTRARAQEVEKTKARLSQELGRTPSEGEVAFEVGMTIGEYRRFLGQYSRSQVSSLEAKLGGESRTETEFQDRLADIGALDPQSEADTGDLQEQLAGAIGELGERERLIVTLYFHEGLTLKEIGKTLDLTEGRISQILSKTLKALRGSLTPENSLVA